MHVISDVMGWRNLLNGAGQRWSQADGHWAVWHGSVERGADRMRAAGLRKQPGSARAVGWRCVQGRRPGAAATVWAMVVATRRQQWSHDSAAAVIAGMRQEVAAVAAAVVASAVAHYPPASVVALGTAVGPLP